MNVREEGISNGWKVCLFTGGDVLIISAGICFITTVICNLMGIQLKCTTLPRVILISTFILLFILIQDGPHKLVRFLLIS